jgi:predicted metal-binding protein
MKLLIEEHDARHKTMAMIRINLFISTSCRSIAQDTNKRKEKK